MSANITTTKITLYLAKIIKVLQATSGAHNNGLQKYFYYLRIPALKFVLWYFYIAWISGILIFLRCQYRHENANKD